MDVLLIAFESTVSLCLRMGSVMFISLFGVELFMQRGLMSYLKPVGRPIAGLARLPAESAVCFLTGIGSMIAAHTMTAQFHESGRLSRRQAWITGVLNTVPFHFKETLTFQLPVVLPLLGFKLCMIYIAAFWLTGIIKLLFVLTAGRFHAQENLMDDRVFDDHTCEPDDPECTRPSLFQSARNAWNARKKMFIKMMATLAGVTFILQILIHAGMLEKFEVFISPLTGLFSLPPSVVGPISAYIFSPTVGITVMSNLLGQSGVTPYQAIVALMAGSLIMIPVTRLRRTLPRYTAIYGVKNGSMICALTTGLSMLSRMILLFWLVIFVTPSL